MTFRTFPGPFRLRAGHPAGARCSTVTRVFRLVERRRLPVRRMRLARGLLPLRRMRLARAAMGKPVRTGDHQVVGRFFVFRFSLLVLMLLYSFPQSVALGASVRCITTHILICVTRGKRPLRMLMLLLRSSARRNRSSKSVGIHSRVARAAARPLAYLYMRVALPFLFDVDGRRVAVSR